MYALLFVLMLRLGCQPLLCRLLLVRASVPRLGRVAPTTMLNSGSKMAKFCNADVSRSARHHVHVEFR